MRFANGLAIFQRTNSRTSWNLASFHSPHSLTWRWILSFDLPKRGQGRWFYFSHYGNRTSQWVLFFFRFRLGWQTQEPMWYRDMYLRLRDKVDIAERNMWPGPAYRKPPPLPPITDRNTSVH